MPKSARSKARPTSSKDNVKQKKATAKSNADAATNASVETSKTSVKAKKEHKPRPKSTSGKYKSVRHLLEMLFAKNKDLARDEAKAIVKKEFPDSKYLRTTKTHFSWYKSHIVGHGTFITIDPPAWTKGGPKVKKIQRKEKEEQQNSLPKQETITQKEEHDHGKEGQREDVQVSNEGSKGRVQGSKGRGKGKVRDRKGAS